MASSGMNEDALLTALLTALEDLHNLRSEMHTCIKQGFLNMAKARRSLGRNSVSVLDTREEYSAEVKIDITHEGEEGSERRRSLDSGAVFTRKRAMDSNAVSIVSSGGNLRQRGGGGVHADSDDSPMQSDSDLPSRGDSLSMFAGLVPPPLRKSKKNFASAVEYAVEAANLAHQIDRLRQQLESMKTSKNNEETATDAASG